VQTRIHRALKREMSLLAKLNQRFLDVSPVGATKEDFAQAGLTLLPMSDPNQAGLAQKVALAQTMVQVAQQFPQFHDTREVLRRFYTMVNAQDIDKIMPPPQEAEPLDPISDLKAASQGLPIKAFPGQDHQAHIQFKMAVLQDPTIGQNPLFAQAIPALSANIREHTLLQYEAELKATAGPQLDLAMAAQQLAKQKQLLMQMQQKGALQDPTMLMAQAQLEEVKLKRDIFEKTKITDATKLSQSQRSLDLKERDQDIKIALEGIKIKEANSSKVEDRKAKFMETAMKEANKAAIQKAKS
jgi:hypothetical protein